MLLLLVACRSSPAPGESDRLPQGTLHVQRAGAHEVVVRRAGVATELLLDGRVVVDARWRPDRPAVAADGTVAFVSGITGIASVYVLQPGREPVQLTNTGLEHVKRSPGKPPTGFVAPPVGELAFDGDLLRWQGPDGPHEARWR